MHESSLNAGPRPPGGDRPEVRLLGQVEVVKPGGARADLQLQCRKVLALLTVTAGRAATTGQLVRRIWGDDAPSRAPQMVRSHIHVLRGVLGGDERIVATTAAGYLMVPGGCVVDAERFRELLSEARRRLRDDVPAATRAAGAALELWRDTDAMPDVADVLVLRAEAAYLEELRCQAEETMVHGWLLSGRADMALPRVRKLAELHPKRERFWLQLMVAEALDGRLVEATGSTFWRARHHLVEETGLRAVKLDLLQRELLNGRTQAERLLGLITESGQECA